MHSSKVGVLVICSLLLVTVWILNDLSYSSLYEGNAIVQETSSMNEDNDNGKGSGNGKESRGVKKVTAAMSHDSHVTQKLVIVTYMRSGSSFTGDLFQNHEDTFYVYEPLYTLGKLYPSPKEEEITFFTKEDIRVPPHGDVFADSSESANTLDAILSCDFTNVNMPTLGQGHMHFSTDTRPFYECARRSGLKACLGELYSRCKQSHVTVAKVIRLTMTQAGQLLTSDPTIKVIHLMRDPRGMFASQLRVANLNWTLLDEESAKRCDRIYRDIVTSLQLSEKFPGRILTVRYEDIAQRPVESAEQMYKFVGLTMTQKHREYIHNITNGKADSCSICTTRTNATHTAYKWRERMDFGSITTIDRNCARVYRDLGFRSYSDPEDVMRYLPKEDSFSDMFYKIKYSDVVAK